MKNTYSAALALLLSFYCTATVTEPTEPDFERLSFTLGRAEQPITGERTLPPQADSVP